MGERLLLALALLGAVQVVVEGVAECGEAGSLQAAEERGEIPLLLDDRPSLRGCRIGTPVKSFRQGARLRDYESIGPRPPPKWPRPFA